MPSTKYFIGFGQFREGYNEAKTQNHRKTTISIKNFSGFEPFPEDQSKLKTSISGKHSAHSTSGISVVT